MVVLEVFSVDAGGGLVSGPASEGSESEWTCSKALARANSVGVSDSAETEAAAAVLLARARSIGGRSLWVVDDVEELARETSADVDSKKLSSVDAEVEAWLERVSAASGPFESAAVILICRCYDGSRVRPIVMMGA